ncbi:UNVERIFIED_CONTAM: hypothetical protein K2H54_063850 [Gekko kuhli]
MLTIAAYKYKKCGGNETVFTLSLILSNDDKSQRRWQKQQPSKLVRMTAEQERPRKTTRRRQLAEGAGVKLEVQQVPGPTDMLTAPGSPRQPHISS